jgi:hypothetical protein
MEEEAKPPPAQKPKTPHLIPETAVALWNWVWSFFELQSVGDDVKDHAPLVKKRVSVLIFLALIGLWGYEFRGCRDEDKVNTANSLANSNAVVAKIFESQLQAANQKNVAEKIDANEMKRQKDAEIAKITSERDNALQRNAQLDLLPQTAQLLYSNSIALNNANVQSYELKINGLGLTNYIVGQSFVIPLNKKREIFLQVGRLKEGQKSIDKFTVDFFTTIDATNLLIENIPDRWMYLPNHSEFLGRPSAGIEIIAKYVVTSFSG